MSPRGAQKGEMDAARAGISAAKLRYEGVWPLEICFTRSYRPCGLHLQVIALQIVNLSLVGGSLSIITYQVKKYLCMIRKIQMKDETVFLSLERGISYVHTLNRAWEHITKHKSEIFILNWARPYARMYRRSDRLRLSNAATVLFFVVPMEWKKGWWW